MQSSKLSLHILLFYTHCFLTSISGSSQQPVFESIAISCGSSSDSTAPDGRVWATDTGSQMSGRSAKTRAIKGAAIDVPYGTARISNHDFAYNFPVKPGHKFIRLHFNQASYKGFKNSRPFFTVKAEGYTLLTNFTAASSDGGPFSKEFCINAEDSMISITFSPVQGKTGESSDSYAFVNGVEVVSMPAGLYFTPDGDHGPRVVGRKYRFYVDNSTALEMVRRVNIGGDSIPSVEDGSMFREWIGEKGGNLIKRVIPINYTFTPSYAAPKKVYQTAKSIVDESTWNIPLDVGFRYLIRLHFCELELGIIEPGERVFSILINNQVAEDAADIIRWGGKHSKFSYIFPLSPGQKILRLYFYPAGYYATDTPQYFDITQSFFGVTANQYTLLTNFSASLTVSSLIPRATYLVKEFIVNVQPTQALNLTFLPMHQSYAFINGIEVVSIPANLYMGSHNLTNNPIRLVNFPNTQYVVDQNFTAFETLYRLNVGGRTVTGEGDTGMFRDWLQDDSFLSGGITGNPLSNNTMPLTYSASQTPNYSAPATVYQTARAMSLMVNQIQVVNLTWSFQVDTGFFYLFRLHFCEIQPGLFFKERQRIFTVFIGNLTAEDVDVIQLAGGTGIPVFKDYVISVANPASGESKYDLFLALAPARQFKPAYYSALLNGIEIFKLNSTTGNLAGLNPDPPRQTISSSPSPNSQPPGRGRKKNSVGMIAGVGGGIAGAAAIIFLLILFIIGRRWRGTKDFDRESATKSPWNPPSTQSKSTPTAVSTEASTATAASSLLSSDLCRRFHIQEIKSATRNFDSSLVIGTGGFGKVYKGSIDQNLTAVAIKRSDPCSSQGLHEFRTEIEMLSNLRHLHLVSLIGYCDDDNELILVYDYMPNGSLRDHLYRTENQPLTWKQRLEICIGAARGLSYLHSEANQVVIHRDIKSNNILLDENWVAKISDFGLSKMGAPDESFIHFSTNVKGTFGYLDPEYFSTKKLTRKSDVYAFGVVLFEVLSGRPAVDTRLDEEQHSLATWARSCIRNRQVDELIDSNLEGQISPACLKLFVGVARRCIDTHPPERPPMADVVVSLEMALVLQQNPTSAQQADEEENIYVFT